MISTSRDDPYRAFCDGRQRTGQFRQLQETDIRAEGSAWRDGQSVANFSSNDYLGLSQHPALIAKAQEYTTRYGAGSTASRLITGNNPAYRVIEDTLARGKGSAAALVLNTGYQANVTVLAALADQDVVGKPVTVVADRLCHNSLLQGILLSGARLMRFRHNDYGHLKTILRQQCKKSTRVIVVSESVFGMDGDRADLTMLIGLADYFGTMLYIDEAHATGLYGPDGFGLSAANKGEIDIVMGTFGKALGSFGAYIACNATIRDYLLQRCDGLIYSTALPPAILGAIEAALERLPQMQDERDYIQHQSARLRAALQRQGWNCGESTTQIIPVILGDEQAAASLAESLLRQGMLVPAIRPPTVPRGTSRLRISISAVHKAETIDRLITAMDSHTSVALSHPSAGKAATAQSLR